jgi:hypothetical protein
MKQTIKKSCAVLLLVTIVASLGIAQFARSSVPIVDEIQSVFIDNVLPFDVSKYTVAAQYDPSNIGDTDIVHFTLQGLDSNITVTCYIDNNALSGCTVTVRGHAVKDEEYATLTDAAIGFLEKYENYSKRDLSPMINMLAGVDASKNYAALVGNLNCTIRNYPVGTAQHTSIKFTDVYNGAPSVFLIVDFQDGYFEGFSDSSVRFTVGDTTVNISKEQAIDISLQRIRNFSFAMNGGVEVSGFNVTRIDAELSSAVTTQTSNVLEPCWDVNLYLNQTYPGSVHGLLVRIWAGSGQVFLCNVIAYDSPDDWPSPSGGPTAESTASSIGVVGEQVNIGEMAALICAGAAIVAVCVAAPLVIRKRGKTRRQSAA